jgi:hypothetical protein
LGELVLVPLFNATEFSCKAFVSYPRVKPLDASSFTSVAKPPASEFFPLAILLSPLALLFCPSAYVSAFCAWECNPKALVALFYAWAAYPATVFLPSVCP